MVIAAKLAPADAGAPRGYEKHPTATRWPHSRTALKCVRSSASNSASVSSRRWKGFGVFLSAYMCFSGEEMIARPPGARTRRNSRIMTS